MYVLELVQPGVWLEGIDDDDLKRDVESLLRLLTNCVEDAAISLTLFDEARRSTLEPSEDRVASWQADRERERRIEAQLEQSLPSDLDFHGRFAALDEIREFARQEGKRQRWREGRIPDGYLHRMPFLHAKSFVYALDTLQKSLEQLSHISVAPPGVRGALADYRAAFPDLIHVRDSSHHAEDRVRGRRREKRIKLKPVENSAVSAPGGVLIVDMLNDRRYGGTLGDGSYGEVDVSQESLRVAGCGVQRVLESFSWSGPPRHLPS